MLFDMTHKKIENKPTFRCGNTDERGVFFEQEWSGQDDILGNVNDNVQKLTWKQKKWCGIRNDNCCSKTHVNDKVDSDNGCIEELEVLQSGHGPSNSHQMTRNERYE